MDVKERWDDMGEVMRTSGDRKQSQIWTALPVKVIEDSDGFTVKLKPTIKGRRTEPSGKAKDEDMPDLHDVPVQYSAGGGFTITHPIKKGDEGIAIFSSRCIDNWHDKGDAQPQGWERWHDLADAMYVPGIRSKPRKLGGPDEHRENEFRSRGVAMAPKGTPASTTSVQIRSDDGKYYVELGPDGAVNIVCKTLHIQAEDHIQAKTKEVIIEASSKVHLKTPNFEVTGNIKAGGEVEAHSGVSNVQMNWQPMHPASQTPANFAAPRGTWVVYLNEPDLAFIDKADGDYWIADAVLSPEFGDVPPLSSVPGLDYTRIKDGDQIVWDLAHAIFLHVPYVAPPVDPDNPDAPPEEPWVGVLGIRVLEEEPSDIMGSLSTAIGLPGDMFNIVGAINEKVPEISHLFNGAHIVEGLTDSMNFNTLVTAFPSQIGKIVGNPIMQAIIRLSGHAHHGVRSGINKSQKPVTGS